MQILDQIIRSQKNGEGKGIASICSAHPWVLRESLRIPSQSDTCLIEATCNQVNQYGGYTGMRPADFVRNVQAIAEEAQFPLGHIVLGGDHLGPNVWQDEPAESAMPKSEVLIKDFVQAGFIKIHIDCSMRLKDDPATGLNPEVSASRTAQLARVAEQASKGNTMLPRYVIGTEVPIPGGAQEHETGAQVTRVEEVSETLQLMYRAFKKQGLESAWERVLAIVVQPGVEFGDDFVLDYQPTPARDLSRFIESQPMVYEAHSTDYQTPRALRNLVQDHFAILKVGPWLTYAYREAVFALAMIEDQLFPTSNSHLIEVMDQVMVNQPRDWERHYRGTPEEQAIKRRYSFSDRIRYYWNDPRVETAVTALIKNLSSKPLPLSLLSQFLPNQYQKIRQKEMAGNISEIISDHIRGVLKIYASACRSDNDRILP